MNSEIIDKIKELKHVYDKQGFVILGVFGSYARGEETSKSDIDILYEMTSEFYQRYPGWDAFPIIEEIECECSKKLGKKVDMANKNALNEIGKKYILHEVVYVSEIKYDTRGLTCPK